MIKFLVSHLGAVKSLLILLVNIFYMIYFWCREFINEENILRASNFIDGELNLILPPKFAAAHFGG